MQLELGDHVMFIESDKLEISHSDKSRIDDVCPETVLMGMVSIIAVMTVVLSLASI